VSNVIEIEGLRKEYRRIRGGSLLALDGLDLAVPQGGVFGFLGPNGSGKTTTIRCLLGLVRPTGGACRILGANPHSNLSEVIPRIGSIVETPMLFPGFSGRRNLEILGRVDAVASQTISEALETVGLTERARDLVKNYSLGMRQRLGIAAALMKDPELLILDEPANGLDPAGIKDVRELLRTLGAEGRTVFVSSHILAEVRQSCDSVAILARGRCVASGPVEQILAGGGARDLIVRLADLGAGLRALRAAGIDSALDGDCIRVKRPASDAEQVSKVLAMAGLYLTELRQDEVDLETVFLELTSDPDPEATK
jgi:ABC-2 type transport system ATP-binding protein